MGLLLIFLSKFFLAFSSTCPYDSWTSGGNSGCNSSKYMIDSKICEASCPSLFTSYQQCSPTCYNYCSSPTGANAILFTLEFSTIKNLQLNYIVSSTDSTEKFINPLSIAYNSATKNSPLPTLDRGFYFAPTSKASSNKSHIPGLYFTLNLWIKSLASGQILNVISSTNSYIQISADPSNAYTFTVIIYDSNGSALSVSGSSSVHYTSYWHTASMTLSQISCSDISFTFSINGLSAGSILINNAEVRYPGTSFIWTLGDAGNSFRGFIYWLQARADTTAFYGAMSNTIECVDKQYWDGSACQDCNVACNDWPWCVRSSNCNYCYSPDCSSCSGYLLSMCTACGTGISPGCCDVNGATCTQTWTNTVCNAGKFLIGDICLNACPYGFGNCLDPSLYVSTPVITADFTGPFAGSYGTAWITAASSSSYNYWSSPETSDPFPAKNRGLYFNSNQYLAASIDLSYTWSIAMWVYAISGTIISHSDNSFDVIIGTTSITVQRWDGLNLSYSLTNSLSSNVWTYISYSMGFVNKAAAFTQWKNNISTPASTYTNRVFRVPAGGTLYIGKGSTYFNGFISYFQLWQVVITDFSAGYNLYGFTGSIVKTLWPCDYSHYYDGISCQSCLASCTIGCTRGVSCYICDDILCSKCLSFSSGDCTECIANASGSPCLCNSGYYQQQSQAVCLSCYSACSICDGGGYHQCKSCKNGSYFLSVQCLNECPWGYSPNSATNNCDLISVSFSISFSNNILLGTMSGVKVGSSNSNSYPIYDTYDPYPAYLRGYYFNPNSFLLTSFMFAPNFSIYMWIKAFSDGLVLTKYIGSIRLVVQILSSGSPMIDLLLSDLSTTILVAGPSSILNNWYYVSFSCTINTDGTTTVKSYIDGALKDTAISANPLYFQDSQSGDFYIGSNSQGFSGFLWKLKFFSENSHSLDDWKGSGCTSPCTKCSVDLTCPDDCPLSKYFNGSSCSDCITSCSKGCRNSDTCRLCKTKECATCIEFSGANSCLTCITNAISDGSGGCTCALNAFWVSATQTCEICDSLCSVCIKTTYFECSTCSENYKLIGSACINGCPYGFGVSCLPVSTPVIDQSFNGEFQGSYGIFRTGTSSATFQFFNSPETYDPIPAYKRGLFFDGSTYLLSSTEILISHSFSIGAWIYVISNGDWLQKLSRLTLSSTGDIKTSLESPTQVLAILSLPSGSTISDWAYLSVTFKYISDSTTLTIYINGISAANLAVSNYIFRDLSLTNLMIGKSDSSGFIGFINNFQLWNIPIIDFTTYINTMCGSGHSCAWSCNLSHYYNGASCSACNSCSKGCVRASTCNICNDVLCSVCTGFDYGKCTQCIANASGAPSSCTCNTGFIISSDGFSCMACSNGCSQCTDITYQKCISCLPEFYFFANTGQCLTACPSGFTINTGTNTCDYLTNLGASLDLTDQIRLDTVSGFSVGNNNANVYPDWSDIYDPIPSYKRGYYFDQKNYLSTTVMIAPSFTISIWVKALGAGILMTKYTSNDILKIKIDSSGNPLLLIVFSDLSAATLSTSVSILNSWHFLSFTGQVQTDGKTILNSYINTVPNNYLITTSLTYFKDTQIGTLFVGNDETLGNLGLKGFLARLIIYNSYDYQFDDYTTSSCISGCLKCPSNHQCLSECALNEYPDSCTACLPGCDKGCVSDLTCRLCRDKECLSCTTFTGECLTCISNAYKPSDHCMCIASALWIFSSQSCELCNPSCSVCSYLNTDNCLACATGYSMNSGKCVKSCSSGYLNSPIGCVLAKKLIFDLDLNTLSGVVYDKASSIPVITGSSEKFYPDYEDDDPIPAYMRGFYFNGKSSIMRMPEYSNYMSPKLIIASMFAISIWINSEISNYALLSKHTLSEGLSIIYAAFVMNDKPGISLIIDSSSFMYICQTSFNHYEWSHLAFTLEQLDSGYNSITCYINASPSPSALAGYEDFQDKISHTTMTIGAQLSLDGIYNFYQGFIYKIQIYNGIIPISQLSTTICSENCGICPVNQICIPNCKIYEYWIGPSYNACFKCNINCKKSCRDWRSTCSLCENLLCKDCIDYSAAGCVACEEKAINPESCICDIDFVLDISNKSSCIPIESGGFRGSDGLFYSCPDLCTSCESLTKCIACVENASLSNNLCHCGLGYSGAKQCSRVAFSASLRVLSDNSLYLNFSDNLINPLSSSDFTIKIKNHKDFSWKIEHKNETYYYISLSFDSKVSKGTLLVLEFLNLTEIRSVSNGLLNSSEISANLNSYDPDSYSSTISSITSQTKAATQTIVAVSAVLSIINPSASSLWTMMNTLQILSYLTLSGIPLSDKMIAFLNSLNSFSFFPNIFIYFIEKDQGNTPYSQAQTFGYDSDLILINQGDDFTIILASLVAFPAVFYFSRCSLWWLNKKFRKALSSYRYAFYLRFWIQCYLEIGAAASIGLVKFGYSNPIQAANIVLCIILYIPLAITPPLLFWFSYKNKNKIKYREKAFNNLFSTFFYEFRTDKGLLATQYYFLFFARRLIYIASLVYLRDYPKTEVTINILLSLSTIMHLFFYWPFSDQIVQISNLLTEILVWLVMIAISVYLFYIDNKIVAIFEYTIVAAVITVMGIQLFSSVAIFSRTIYHLIRKNLKKSENLEKYN
ncbi:unnamed protein product [Blepharisma stoltei]|uniref:TNFR-Cys domain-containing protein n=1 Tax=Blepharisma stoltei TaxID=1481888 RepID=A0AAU9K6L2_9CILI|nr:unnamed protein product [Blepharisma stoltei]